MLKMRKSSFTILGALVLLLSVLVHGQSGKSKMEVDRTHSNLVTNEIRFMKLDQDRIRALISIVLSDDSLTPSELNKIHKRLQAADRHIENLRLGSMRSKTGTSPLQNVTAADRETLMNLQIGVLHEVIEVSQVRGMVSKNDLAKLEKALEDLKSRSGTAQGAASASPLSPATPSAVTGSHLNAGTQQRRQGNEGGDQDLALLIKQSATQGQTIEAFTAIHQRGVPKEKGAPPVSVGTSGATPPGGDATGTTAPAATPTDSSGSGNSNTKK